jgi:hypothetical protein
MFMLTHTYFLQKVILSAGLKDLEPDIYVYNIAPDLLAFHPQISPAKTHILKRSLQITAAYPKSAYVIFHLLVDDLSHHGYISSGEQEEFNLNSKGYSYVKGIPLIESIMDLHKIIDKEISVSDAVYQSHLIIEMIYDLVILKHISLFKTIDVLVDAVKYTAKNKMNEFVDTIKWLYGLEENEINEVMKSALFFITKEGMEGIMNIEGRINLYRDKFGLQSDDLIFCESLKNLFQRAMDLINDDEPFFLETVQVIKNYNNFNLFK